MKILRVDDRLIHGQIISGLIPFYNISNLILLNYNLPKEMVEIYKNMMSPDIKLYIIDPKDDIPEKDLSIYIVENLKILKFFLKGLIKIKFDIFNLGGLRNRENKEKFLDFLYMDEDDINIFFETISKFDFKQINAQQIPSTESYDIKNILLKRSKHEKKG